ncbi:uncharacterized protein LOC112010032 isoform X2 [Quercus suber]|uniref:uncharacterized protein LOC112010032 isoform X2 n=1 Tax=Quercus suber TaxID=58331 RepID=UPI0032E03A24
MEVNSVQRDRQDEEEFVLLDLSSVSGEIDIPANAPLGNMKKQLAHAWSSQKKVSVLAFWDPCNVTSSKFLCREDGNPVVHEEVGPSEANLFSGKCIIDPNQTPSKQVKPLTQLQKILKFRLATDADIQCLTAEQTK